MWSELGVHHVGLTAPKLDVFGHDAAVAALRERNIKASCIVAGTFDLRKPETWDASREGFVRCMDTAAALDAPYIYITTGRTTGARGARCSTRSLERSNPRLPPGTIMA